MVGGGVCNETGELSERDRLIMGRGDQMPSLRLYGDTRLLLVKCYENKMVKSPYNCCLILKWLTNKKKKKKKKTPGDFSIQK